MALTKAVIIGGIGGIAVPFAIGGSTAPVSWMVSMMTIHGPGGVSLPWSWPVFCIITLSAWALLHFTRD